MQTNLVVDFLGLLAEHLQHSTSELKDEKFTLIQF
jgi:hypothetical protein